MRRSISASSRRVSTPPRRIRCRSRSRSSAGHAVLRAGRVLSWPSRARAGVSVRLATAAEWRRQLRISSTASFLRCPCGSGRSPSRSDCAAFSLTAKARSRPSRGSSSKRSSGCFVPRRARPVTATGRAWLARDSAPSPFCTASDRRSITTCTCEPRATDGVFVPTGDGPPAGASCRLGQPPRPIWPRSPRRCAVVSCVGSACSGS